MRGARYVGVDVSADEITVAIEGRAERVTLANDVEGHERLIRLLIRRGRPARVCLEATGSTTSTWPWRCIERERSR